MWHRIAVAVFVSAVVLVDPSAAKAVDGLVLAEQGRAKLPVVVPPELTAADPLPVAAEERLGVAESRRGALPASPDSYYSIQNENSFAFLR